MTMNVLARVGFALIVTVVAAGCAPWTPEQRTTYEEQERRQAMDCGLRGGWFVSGSCISRGGGQ